MADPDLVTIISAERVDSGLLIQFSDRLSVLYHTRFLYDVRNQDGNVALPLEQIEEEEKSEPLRVPRP